MPARSATRWMLAIAIATNLAVATAVLGPTGAHRPTTDPGPAPTAPVPEVPPQSPSTVQYTGIVAADSVATTTPGPVPSQPSTTPASPTPPPAPTDSSTRTLVRLHISSTADWATIEVTGLQVLAQRPPSTTGATTVTAVGSSTVALAVRGAGTAALDVVGFAPSGGAFAVVSCKSPGGTVRVHAVRDTGAPVTIAELVNSRSDGVSSGDCENQVRRDVSRAELLGPTAWPPRVDDRRLALAFYYPWYDDGTFLSGSWRDHPLRPWNTDSRDEVTQMVGLAAASGIDGFVVSYNHYPATVRRFAHVVAAAEALQGSFLVAPLLELGFLAHQQGTDTVGPDELETWLRAVLERSSSPAWLRVGDRPVVFLYGRDNLNPEVWTEVRRRLRSDGLDPFVLGESAHPAFAYDGLYQYSPNVVAEGPELQPWYRRWELESRLLPALQGSRRRVLWAAPVSPGQDDTLLGRPREETLVVERDGGARYDQTWEAALETRPDWALITSWNEFYENTEVAPSEAHGHSALEQTARWAARFSGGG